MFFKQYPTTNIYAVIIPRIILCCCFPRLQPMSCFLLYRSHLPTSGIEPRNLLDTVLVRFTRTPRAADEWLATGLTPALGPWLPISGEVPVVRCAYSLFCGCTQSVPPQGRARDAVQPEWYQNWLPSERCTLDGFKS